MRIRWSQPAAADLKTIAEYIRRDSPHSASRVTRTLYSAVKQLRFSPTKGGWAGSREPANSSSRHFRTLSYIVYQRMRF
jgi:plasmid stabilization system protein ParE